MPLAADPIVPPHVRVVPRSRCSPRAKSEERKRLSIAMEKRFRNGPGKCSRSIERTVEFRKITREEAARHRSTGRSVPAFESAVGSVSILPSRRLLAHANSSQSFIPTRIGCIPTRRDAPRGTWSSTRNIRCQRERRILLGSTLVEFYAVYRERGFSW